MTEHAPERTIVFFDGVCHLCNAFVDFVVQRDKNHHLLFAPLQGETAAKTLSAEQRAKLDSVIVWDRTRVLEKSSAIRAVLRELGGGWKILALLMGLVPGFLRDFVYDWVAKNRYRWFGKRESCRLPTKEERGQILP